ncbi:MAG: DUF6788 family protein [Blastocatellia bacterium]
MESLPGAVVAQWVRCGHSNCKCASGERHGPYFYHFWWEEGHRRKAYVRLADVEALQTACEAYRTEQRENRQIMQESAAEWRRLKALLKELGL